MGKRKGRKKKNLRLIHILLILVIFWVGRSIINQQITIRQMEKTIMEEEKEIEKLEREIEALSKEIKEKDSLEFIEKTAREDLKMVKPREIMYIDLKKEKNPFVNRRKR